MFLLPIPVIAFAILYLISHGPIIPSLVAGYLLVMLRTGGQLIPANATSLLKGHLWMRILVMKFMKMNGPLDDLDFWLYDQQMGDDGPHPEIMGSDRVTVGNSDLRTLLCDAAAADPHGWESYANKLWLLFRNDPLEYVPRFKCVIYLLTQSNKGLQPHMMDPILKLGQMWKIGPENVHRLIKEMSIPEEEMEMRPLQELLQIRSGF